MSPESYRQAGIVEEGDGIVIADVSSSSIDKFFERMCFRVEILSHQEYAEETALRDFINPEEIGEGEVLEDPEPSPASTQLLTKVHKNGNYVEARIRIDRSRFPDDDELAFQFIDLVVFHEAMELWFDTKKGFRCDRNNTAHKLALRVEYGRAVVQGIADEYFKNALNLKQYGVWQEGQWDDYVKENKEALEKAKGRYERRLILI